MKTRAAVQEYNHSNISIGGTTMNGVHDMGGMHGFGPVKREEHEQPFHAEWEKIVFAINRVSGSQGLYDIDESRYGIERMKPGQYLTSSYYERWLDSAIRNLTEKGIIDRAELDQWIERISADPSTPLPESPSPDVAERLAGRIRAGRNYRREDAPPRFQVGDAVCTRNIHPRGHTRLPRYARGKRGVIAAVHGTYVFPDTNATGQGEQPQPLYNVRFKSSELWSNAAEPNTSVGLDLWESYLEPNEPVQA